MSVHARNCRAGDPNAGDFFEVVMQFSPDSPLKLDPRTFANCLRSAPFRIRSRLWRVFLSDAENLFG